MALDSKICPALLLRAGEIRVVDTLALESVCTDTFEK